MKNNYCFIFLVFLFLFGSCSKSRTTFDSVEDFNNYLNDVDNGFIQKTVFKGVVYEAKLIPALDEDDKKNITVQLRISLENAGNVLEFEGASQELIAEREMKLSFGMQDLVTMNINGKSLNPLFSHYERNYGLKPSVDLLFQFEEVKSENVVVFRLNDQIFSNGIVEIEFDNELFTTCYVKK